LEVELKYKIRDKEMMAEILKDACLAGMEEKGSREQVCMKAVYFDTEDYVLSKNDVAFRVRMEGKRIIASLKWNGSNSGGLHVREEINVPVNDPACFTAPDPGVFRESEAGKDVLELLNKRPLRGILEMKFLRSKLRIDAGSAICEVSADEGEIYTDFGTRPILELEIELFSGDRETLLAIGGKLAETYGLEPEPCSKYARGLEMIANRP
jgi:triphosphatase